MKYIWKKCYTKFFGRIFLGAHTVQTVPKYIWMQHCELQDHCHLWAGPPKNHCYQLLAFLNLYQYARSNMLETANFRVLCNQTGHIHFWLCPPPPKKNDQLLTFVNLYQHAKNQFIPSVYSLDTVNFKVPSHDGPHPFLTMPNPKTLKLIFMKLYLHAKTKLIPLVNLILGSSNQIGHINILKITVSSICSEEIVYLEILQSDWPRGFWESSQSLEEHCVPLNPLSQPLSK